MADINILMNGFGGLAPYFAGDNNQTEPKPNLRFAGEGQMVSGFYNPFLVNGYLAPTTTTKVTLSTDTTPDTFFGSSLYDNVEDEYYFAERGRRIYKGSGLSDESLTEIVELPLGALIQDLEVYELNGFRKIFYTYESSASTISQAHSASVEGELISLGIQIAGNSSTRPIISHYEAVANSYTSYSHNLDIPTSSNVSIVVIASGRGDVSGITINSNNFTEDFSETKNIADDRPFSEVDNSGGSSDYNFSVWHYYGPASGSQDVVVSASSGYKHLTFLIFENSASSPVDDVDLVWELSDSVVVESSYNENNLYLQYTVAKPSMWTSANSTFEEHEEAMSSKTTDSEVSSFYIGDGGTKYYQLAIDTNGDYLIYELALSSAWDVETMAASSTTSFNLNYGGEDPNVADFKFSSDGTKLYLIDNAETTKVLQYTLGTAWDITSINAVTTQDFSSDIDGDIRGFDITDDDEKFYFLIELNSEYPDKYFYEINLSVAGDVTSATVGDRIELPDYPNLTVRAGVSIASDNRIVYFRDTNYSSGGQSIMYRMVLPEDRDITEARFDSGNVEAGQDGNSIQVHPKGTYWWRYGDNTNDIQRFTMPESLTPSLSTSTTPLIENTANSEEHILLSQTTAAGFKIDVGHESIPSGVSTESWLVGEKEINSILSSSRYNFLRKADNGFLYLFAKNRVHKIDGTITGGQTGSVTRNVLVFPDFFTISDAVDYRSQMYIAVNKADLDLSDNTRGNYTGGAYVYVWNRNSVQLSASASIEIPGIRLIKKIYPGPDGHLKIIVINDAGVTELRRFGYNDSGSAVFSEAIELGLGAHPQYPDAVSVVGDKTVWLANNGTLFTERDMAIFKIQQVETTGSVPSDTITAGAVLFGSGVETASSPNREDKQGVIMSYKEGLNNRIYKSYPFDYTTGSGGAQTPNQGDVYTGVNLIPVTSKVDRLRLYNAPISGSGTDVVATVKIYFNQSTSASYPDGMTKSITKDEAKRGYVDFLIKKPYVHAVQIEVEWATGENIGDDMYLPSAAVISHEPKTTAGPDNE